MGFQPFFILPLNSLVSQKLYTNFTAIDLFFTRKTQEWEKKSRILKGTLKSKSKCSNVYRVHYKLEKINAHIEAKRFSIHFLKISLHSKDLKIKLSIALVVFKLFRKHLNGVN